MYDSFGNQATEDETDTNPFRYAGEYFDAETGQIYLRNRYYDPATGRFISEDPVRDGLNWYVYAGNNPVLFVDPFGLFDYYTRLSTSTVYNEDVAVLQNELKWLGFYEGEIDGLFGQQTLDAVNAYKKKMHFGNEDEDEGVVGLQTWTSLGLIYRTQADIDAGVEIIMYGGHKQYKDFSIPINAALSDTVQIAEKKWRIDYPWFISQVNHKKPWDIKREEPWNETIAANTYPGWGVKVYYDGYLMTPEELGNYTYGYIGAALGLSYTELYGGSWVAAKFPIGGDDLKNEFNDWISITLGSEDYKNR